MRIENSHWVCPPPNVSEKLNEPAKSAFDFIDGATLWPSTRFHPRQESKCELHF